MKLKRKSGVKRQRQEVLHTKEVKTKREEEMKT